jgi:hypothetical protein
MKALGRLAEVVNDHKAELVALQCMMRALIRALPTTLQAEVLAQWDSEKEAARTMLLNTSAPDDLLKTFECHLEVLDGIFRSQE